MIERVARAMARQDRGSDRWDLIPDGYSSYGEDGLFKGEYIDIARAAIEAMREPSKEMQNAFLQQGYKRANFALQWASAIDAALEQEQANA
jgi:predicted ArsR family transcriptional regulator